MIDVYSVYFEDSFDSSKDNIEILINFLNKLSNSYSIDTKTKLINLNLTGSFKLLSYDEMLDLFNKDRSVFEKVFANMTANQKETLKRIIFEKLNENEKSVDMNIVQVINDNLGIDIMDDFRNQKKLSEILKNDN